MKAEEQQNNPTGTSASGVSSISILQSSESQPAQPLPSSSSLLQANSASSATHQQILLSSAPSILCRVFSFWCGVADMKNECAEESPSAKEKGSNSSGLVATAALMRQCNANLSNFFPSAPIRYSTKRPQWLQKGWLYAKRFITPLPICATMTLITFIYVNVFRITMNLLEEYSGERFAAESESPQAWAIRMCIQSFMAVGHILLGLLLWSYFKTVFSRELQWDREDLENQLVEAKRLNIGSLYPSFCQKCDQFRPCRAHHCSWCGRCIDKMDHHCPWIGRCIGRHNYKSFYLFVFYVTITNAFVFGCIYISWLTRIVSWYEVETFLLLTGLLAFSQGVFLVFHTYLLINNMSTIEFILWFTDRGRDLPSAHPFDHGLRSNLEEVLGPNKMFWFLPITSYR
eukprot:TRINITY_DN7135_c0_g1_i1.p1 TRINITY_DN7135_c0_g1~~TRINITY_DN7135_c0_g1_i1.p1  ORF type:complete len:401 (+),score=29.76 TRINITY_DN7135_c0_g1_i1:229-1431(+)